MLLQLSGIQDVSLGTLQVGGGNTEEVPRNSLQH